ncbi:pyrroline-5-carboxylate reductase [Halalkalibacter wakoensis JCM 9140]|uniref:Pyrroline-5-carboxylate reductase n=1 Tax=Halalkalibacter wakoensis JCM 9140 TaxID=1236970 RepID=W4Q3Q8_9BACI|nr:pyrroline-5-carboxylate reductase [Halalkalibacter wakoensis]GAE26358.1 pyrroline-5-carboxylate reductase [Halalkalibacter wakoensis JCM 9140]
MKQEHILFIGAGRMAEAILAGMVQTELNMKITVSNQQDTKRLHQLQNQYAVESTEDWRHTVEHADVILLACPPSEHPNVLTSLNPLLTGSQLVMTVAAGIGPSVLESSLPDGTATAWLMPNTSADVQKSMSIYSYGQYVTSEQKLIFEKIVSSIGPSEELSEQQVHQMTAVTGSAPAFLYYFVEALEEAAASYGISNEQARKLVIEMVIGSAAMLDKHRDPEKLRYQVTSPGGATAAGIESLQKDDFTNSLIRAVHATNHRAKELGSSKNLF